MIGARSAKILGVGIGDTIRVDGSAVPLHIVGVGLLTQTPHTTFDEGALVTMRALDTVSHTTLDQREAFFLMSAEPGVKLAEVQAALHKIGLDATPPDPVPDVLNLSNVRSLPYLLAGFLMLLDRKSVV